MIPHLADKNKIKLNKRSFLLETIGIKMIMLKQKFLLSLHVPWSGTSWGSTVSFQGIAVDIGDNEHKAGISPQNLCDSHHMGLAFTHLGDLFLVTTAHNGITLRGILK